MYANVSDTLFNQKSPVYPEAGFLQWHTQTHRHTTHGHHDLETELVQTPFLYTLIHSKVNLCCFLAAGDHQPNYKGLQEESTPAHSHTESGSLLPIGDH